MDYAQKEGIPHEGFDRRQARPVLLAYSLPLFGSIIFQQLYNIADSFVAGHFISTEALAAVGNSSEITLISSPSRLAATSAHPS